jgi:ribosomal protein L37AE/L43A
MKLESSRARQTTSQYDFPRCEQCDNPLIAPEWSEQVSARCVRHLWSCEICGYQFEQSVYFAKDLKMGEAERSDIEARRQSAYHLRRSVFENKRNADT